MRESHRFISRRRVLALALGPWAAGRAGAAAEGVRAALVPPRERAAAPAFRLPEASGRWTGNAELRGQVVLLDFWATWCGGCKRELPWFQEFDSRYGPRGFTVAAVSVDDEGWAAVRPYLARTGLRLRVLLGDPGCAERFALQAMPVALLLDRQGRVAARYTGVADRDDMEANIRRLLSER